MSSRFSRPLNWLLTRWQWLTSPPPSVQDPEQRHRARLLAALLLVLLMLGVQALMLTALLNPAQPDYSNSVVALFILILVFALQRQGRFDLAVALLLGAVLLAVVSSILARPTDPKLALLMTGVLISSLFFTVRLTVGVYCVTLLLLLLLYMLPLGLSLDGVFSTIMGTTLVLGLATLSTLDSRRHLKQSELKSRELAESEARCRALSIEHQQAAAEVRQLNIHLEERVQERTAALEASNRGLRLAAARMNALLESIRSGVLVENDARQITRVNRAFCDLFDIAAPDQVVGANCAALEEVAKALFRDPERFVQGIQERLAAREMVTGEQLALVDGRILERDYTPIVAGAQTHGHLWVYSDVTGRQQRERLLRAQRDLALALSKSTGIEEGLRLCLDAAVRASDMDCGGIYLVDQKSGALDLVVSQGLSADFVRESSHYEPDAPHARLVMAGQPVYADTLEEVLPPSEAPRQEGLRAFVAHPLHHPDGHVLGCLNLASHTSATVSFYARTASETMVAQIGNAVAWLSAEDSLRISEERYRTLAETAHDLIFVVNHGGVVEYVNSYAATYLKATPKAIIGKALADLFPSEVFESLRMTLGRVWETLQPLYVEDKVAFPGREVWLGAWLVPLRDRRGQAHAVLGIARDIDERKHMEQELQAQRDFAQQVMAAMGQGLTVTDSEGRFEFVNPAYAHFIGCAPAELIGKRPADVTVAEDQPVLAQARADRQQGKTTAYETHLRRVDGSLVPVLVTGAPRWRGGHVAGTIAVVTDLTERKQAEAALTRQAEELARSNADLERFAYVVSHDLREPLRMVASFVQLLGERYHGQLDADADEFIGFAVDGARRMQWLINDLLEYARVGSRGQPLKNTDAALALDDALWDLRLAIEDAGATVTHDPLPTVAADATQLRQLFQNLIGNAIKFRGAEPPQVHVSARLIPEQAESGRMGEVESGGRASHPLSSSPTLPLSPSWLFSVRDNGIGIDPKDHERIFDIFQRLHTGDAYPGTGIGLAVCQRIVERHGGRIWVESALDQGSTFYFTLPA